MLLTNVVSFIVVTASDAKRPPPAPPSGDVRGKAKGAGGIVTEPPGISIGPAPY